MTADVAAEKNQSRDSRVYLAVLIGMAGQLIAQFLLQRLFAQHFGTSDEKDAYGFAMTLPMHVSAAVGGALAPVLVPMLGRSDEESGRDISGTIGGGLLIGTMLLSAFFWWQSVAVIQLMQPGLSPEKTELTARILRVLIWLLPANSLIGLLYAVLHANLRFGLPALAGVLGPVTTVLIVWQCGADGHVQIETVAWATLCGAIVSILIQLPQFVRLAAWPKFSESGRLLKSCSLLGTPVVLSSLILKVDPFVDRYLLSSLREGSLSRLDYALTFANAFIVLSSGTLSTVAFPRIARQSMGSREELQAEVAAAMRTLVRLILPAAAVLILFGPALIGDLLETGEFTADDTAAVSRLVRIFTVLLVGAGMGELCAKVLYAQQEVRIPLLVTAVAIGTGVVLKFLIVPEMGLSGLVAVTSGVFLGGSLLQLWVILRRLGRPVLSGLVRAVFRSILATGAACLVGALVLMIEFRFHSLVGLTLGGIVYLLVLARLDSEVWTVANSCLSKSRAVTTGDSEIG